jgi:hypothetical protein
MNRAQHLTRALPVPRRRWGWLVAATVYSVIAVAILASCTVGSTYYSGPELLTTSWVIRGAQFVAYGVGSASMYAAAYGIAALLSWLFVAAASQRALVTRLFFLLLAVTLAAQLVGMLILVAASPIPTRPAVLSPLVASGVVYLASDLLAVVICHAPLLLVAGAAAFSLARTRRARAAAHAYGYQVCTTCRYVLVGSPAVGRCPECGSMYDKEHLPAYWQAGLGPIPAHTQPPCVADPRQG